MATKIIAVPSRTVKMVGPDGNFTGQVLYAFPQLLGLLLESTPQKSDAETFLAHSIREKLDSLRQRLGEPPQADGEDGQMPKIATPRLDLEDSEIQFLKAGIDNLRRSERMTGSNWYWLVSPLNEAKVKEKKEEKETK